MPDDKLELVAISKEIVREARSQIAQYRRAFTIEIYPLLVDQTRRPEKCSGLEGLKITATWSQRYAKSGSSLYRR
jgi:hypothetical protein